MTTKEFKQYLKTHNHTEIEQLEYNRENYCYAVGLLYSQMKYLYKNGPQGSAKTAMDFVSRQHSMNAVREYLIYMYKIVNNRILFKNRSNGSIGKLIAYVMCNADKVDFDKTTMDDQILMTAGVTDLWTY